MNLNSRIFSRCFSYDFLPQQAKSWRFVFSWLCVGLLVCVCSRLSIGQIGIISTIAGGGPHNVPANTAHLHNPTDVATDLQGNVYIVTSGQSEVFRIDRDTGILTDAAGSDSNGFSGDNGPATLASMNGPYGLAVDGAGNLFIADTFNSRVRRVDANTHLITTYAGGGVPCAGRTDRMGDGCPATDATLFFPSGLAVDGSGNLLIADVGNNLIRRVDAVTGVITLFFAGSQPSGVSVDSNGNVFIADTGNRRVVKIDVAGNTLSIVAGGGPLCASRTDSVGDGCLATNARLNGPVRAVADNNGNLFIAESNGNRIRRVDAATGIIATFAGTGAYGYGGDDGPAAAATLANPNGIALDGAGNLLIADAKNNRLRQVDASTNAITTVAGASGPKDYDLPALQASLSGVGQVVTDGAENVFISEAGSATLLRLDSVTNLLSKVAGDGFGAPFDAIFGLARDRAGDLFVADETQIWRVNSVTGMVATVAGLGDGCPQQTDGLGDGCPATDAWLEPLSVAVDRAGNLFIGDGAGGNALVRRVDRVTQIITIVAGVVAGGNSGCPQEINDIGDGCPATQVDLGSIGGVALDSKGNVLFASGSRVRRVDALTQVITTVAGNGNESYSGDEGPATSAGIAATMVAVDVVGNLFITDFANYRIRRVDAVTNIVTTVAGNGVPVFSGDGGLATEASIRPSAASIDKIGNLFIGDGPNFRVRKVALGLPKIITSATSLNFGRVRIRSHATQKIMVKNTGTALLEFFKIAASGNFVESNSCGSGVEPGTECEIDVIFSPAQRGRLTGTLTIKPNVAAGNISIPLSGTGIGHAKHRHSMALTLRNS